MQQQAKSRFSQLRAQAGLSLEDVASKARFPRGEVERWENGEPLPHQISFMLELLANTTNPARRGENSFRFIDLFAGIGGLRRGFEPLGGRCVFTSEWDRYAQTTYKANFDCDHEVAGDITKIDAADVPEHDVLLAGFPCQPFSIAGVSKKNSLKRPHGFNCETQGTLFFHVERMIAAHRPKVFLLENVKNLVNHDQGRTFDVIWRTLTEKLGYRVHWKVVNAKSFVPQHRERIFIAGFRDDNDFSFDTLDLPDLLTGPRLKTILHPEDGSEKPDKPFTGVDSRVNEKYGLTDHLWHYYANKHRAKGHSSVVLAIVFMEAATLH